MTGKRRSDATLFREVLDLQPSRGISGVQLDGTLRLMQRFPERGEEILAGLAPHMDKLGQQAFSKVSDAVIRVRPELLEDLVKLGAGTKQGWLLLGKLGTRGAEMYTLCRQHMAEAGEQTLEDYDARCARHGIIHVFYGPASDHSFDLLDAVLAQPGAALLKPDVKGERLDLISTLVVQAILQFPRENQVASVLDRLVGAGVELRSNEEPSKALAWLAHAFGRGHDERAQQYVDLLLAHGAQWRGLALDPSEKKHTALIAYLEQHPRVRADRLEEIAQQRAGEMGDRANGRKRGM